MTEPTPKPAQETPKPIETPAPEATPKPGEQAAVADTPEKLHDAAISAVEAWQANPTDETKKAAADAVAKAKESIKALPKPKAAPEKYDLKLPEGSKLDAKHLEGIAAFAKTRGLSNEDAQAIADRENANLSSWQTKLNEDVKKEIEAWVPQAKADKEVGGEAFEQNVSVARRVVERFGSDDFKKFLNDSGYGNHPEVLRFIFRIGKAMTDDQLVRPGSQPSGEKKPTETVLYGETKEE